MKKIGQIGTRSMNESQWQLDGERESNVKIACSVLRRYVERAACWKLRTGRGGLRGEAALG